MKKLISYRFLGTVLLLTGLIGAKAYSIENPFLAGVSAMDNDAVYGTWGGFPEIPVGPLTYVLQLDIRPSKVSNRVVCKFSDGVSLSVEVASRATITDNQITILDNASNEVSKDGRSCQASISPGTMDYTVSGDHLTVSANGQTMTLDRVSQ